MLFHARNKKEDIELFNKSKFSLLSFESDDMSRRVNSVSNKYDKIEYLNTIEFIFRLITVKREIDFERTLSLVNNKTEYVYKFKDPEKLFIGEFRKSNECFTYLKSLNFTLSNFDSLGFLNPSLFITEIILVTPVLDIRDMLSYAKYSYLDSFGEVVSERDFVDCLIDYYKFDNVDFLFYNCKSISDFVDVIYSDISDKTFSNTIQSQINYFNIAEYVENVLEYYFIEFLGENYSKVNIFDAISNYIDSLKILFMKTYLDIDVFESFIHCLVTPEFNQKLIYIHQLGSSVEFASLRASKQQELLSKYFKEMVDSSLLDSEQESIKYVDNLFNSLIKN